MLRRLLILTTVCLAGLCLVPAAEAATVRISSGKVRYVGGTGEANRLTVTRAPGQFVLTDPSDVHISARGGCQSAGRGRATCPDGGIRALSISAGAGNDVVDLRAAGIAGSVSGGSGDDVLLGGDGPDRLTGGTGDDILDGGNLGDTLSGDEGFDTVTYASRTTGVIVDLDGNADDGAPGEHDNVLNDVEHVVGGSGPDVISAVSGSKRIEGGDGDDQLSGGSGDDVIDGGAGNDRIDGRTGNDTLIGGPGTDMVDYLDSFDAVHASLQSGFAILLRGSGTRLVRERDSISGFEVLRGSTHNDRLRGSVGPDTLIGGRGDDVLDGDLGPDVLIGGAGRDEADYSHRRQGVNVSLDGVANDGRPGEGDLVDPSTEDVSGGAGPDVLTGNARGNVLIGGGGSDQLAGGDGNDRLLGGARADAIDGGNGNDVLSGGTGNDRLLGGEGKDRLVGGTGSDFLDPGPGRDVAVAGPGGDVLALLDGFVDRANCGSGRDRATADKADRLAACEDVTRGGSR